MKVDKTQDLYFYIVGWIFLGAFALFMVVTYVLHWNVLHIFPPCSFNALTHYYCPGCGATRAVVSMIHGDFIRSLFYHPFILYTAVVGGWFMLSQTVDRLTHHRIPIGLHYRNIYLWIALGLIFANWILKDVVLFFTGTALMG